MHVIHLPSVLSCDSSFLSEDTTKRIRQLLKGTNPQEQKERKNQSMKNNTFLYRTKVHGDFCFQPRRTNKGLDLHCLLKRRQNQTKYLKQWLTKHRSSTNTGQWSPRDGKQLKWSHSCTSLTPEENPQDVAQGGKPGRAQRSPHVQGQSWKSREARSSQGQNPERRNLNRQRSRDGDPDRGLLDYQLRTDQYTDVKPPCGRKEVLYIKWFSITWGWVVVSGIMSGEEKTVIS